MAGLPRAKDNSRPRDAWTIMVLGGIERLTDTLRRGEPFGEQALQDMQALDRRLQAFSEALHQRLDVVEDE